MTDLLQTKELHLLKRLDKYLVFDINELNLFEVNEEAHAILSEASGVSPYSSPRIAIFVAGSQAIASKNFLFNLTGNRKQDEEVFHLAHLMGGRTQATDP